MNRDFNEINNKYKILNKQYDIFERNEKININNNINNNNINDNLSQKKWEFLSDIK